MRAASWATIHQSGRDSPAGGSRARCREIRRSELVTVPSFSAQPQAGSSTSAHSVVSVCSMQSETTTSSHPCRAARMRRESGRLTTGLLPMIQIARIRP